MRVLVFGATGSAGGAVLRACLAAPVVERVHAIARRPLAPASSKLRVFIHDNFLDYTAVREAFADMTVCLYCLGVSATQVNGEAEYRRITHDLALAAAREWVQRNPGGAFHFISGRGTTLGSRMMWSRVKAETERDLIALVQATCWRPAAIDAAPSSAAPWFYSFARPFFWLLRPFRTLYVKGEDLGNAMLQATKENIRARTIENQEIRDIADRYRAADR